MKGGPDERDHISANIDKAKDCEVPFVNAKRIIEDYRKKNWDHKQQPANAPLTKKGKKVEEEKKKKEGTIIHLDDELRMVGLHILGIDRFSVLTSRF